MSSSTHRWLNRLIAHCSELLEYSWDLEGLPGGTSGLERELERAADHVQLALEALGRVASEPEEGGPPLRRHGRIAALASRLPGVAARRGAAGSNGDSRELGGESLRGFHGSSATISIPELMGFLQLQGKTGVLHVELEEEMIVIHLRCGSLVQAESDNSPPGCRLGQVLVDQGAITQSTLHAFLVEHGRQGPRLGRALELEDLVSEEQLRSALDLQIQRIFDRLYGVSDAHFFFEEGELEEARDDIRLNVTSLLLESARYYDEKRAGPRKTGSWLLEGDPS